VDGCGEGEDIKMMRYVRAGTVLLALAVGLTIVTSTQARAQPSTNVAAEAVLELVVGGIAGVPVDALAVVLNATVTNPAAAGFVTVWPCGAERPVASNLNYAKDQTVPNLVIAKLGSAGKVCFYSQQATDLVVDVAGFFPAGSGYVAQVNPQRAIDTRGKSRVGGTVIQEVAVAGVYGVPATAAGVALNVTITGATNDGFATIFPCGQPTPTTSSVNYAKGQDVPNFVLAKPGLSGKVCVFSSAPADVIVDVSGYFEADTGFTATAAPVRFLDSRETTRVEAGTTKELIVAGDKGIPANAKGIALNVTAVGASADGFMTVYPCGEPVPLASNLNYTKARDIANSVLAKPGVGGMVCFYTDKSIDIVADVAGYFGADSLSPLPNPTRILDTRAPSVIPPAAPYAIPRAGVPTVSCKTTLTQRDEIIDVGDGRPTLATAWMPTAMLAVNTGRIRDLVTWADRSTVSSTPLGSQATGLVGLTTGTSKASVGARGWGDYFLVTPSLLLWFDFTARTDYRTPNGGGGQIRGIWPLQIDASGLLNFKHIRNAFNWAPNELLPGANAAGIQGSGLSTFITNQAQDNGVTFNLENDPSATLTEHRPIALAETGSGTLHDEGFYIRVDGRFAAAVPAGTVPTDAFLVGVAPTTGRVSARTTFRVAACNASIVQQTTIANSTSSPVGPVNQVLLASNQLGVLNGGIRTANVLSFTRTEPATCVAETRDLNNTSGCITSAQDYTALPNNIRGNRPEVEFLSKPHRSVAPPIVQLSPAPQGAAGSTLTANALNGILSIGVIYDTHSLINSLVVALDAELFNAEYWRTADGRLQIADRTLPAGITLSGSDFFLAPSSVMSTELALGFS
jgi:hypothetical protein